MSVWSSSPGRVGVVIAVERKSPSYKRHSRVTDSVWWSWLIARKTTARPEIEKERRSQRSMVTRIVWSRHRFWSCWSWKSFCTLKRKEESSVYSTLQNSVWSWLTSADCRGDSGQRQTDGRRDTRVMAGRWSSVSNPRQYHGGEYFSILFRRWPNVHPIPDNTTQYHKIPHTEVRLW